MQQAVNPNMILLAKDARYFSQTALAHKLHSCKANISRLEHGDAGADEETLMAISEATNSLTYRSYEKQSIC